MKKTILKVIAVAAILILPSQVLAAAQEVIGGTPYTVPGSSLTISPSSKVHVLIISATTNYGIKAAHQTGDRIFGTNNLENRIFWFSTGATDATSDTTNFVLTNSSPAFAGGWSAY